jgi:LacI family transcriptional regulator
MGKMAAFWVLKHVYQTADTQVSSVFIPELVVRGSVLPYQP